VALQLGHALAGRAARVAGIEPATLLYSGLLLATTIVGQLLAFLGQILLARCVGIEAFGTYSYVVSWVSVLALAATVGTDRLLIRFVSEYRQRAEYSKIVPLLRWSARLAGAGAAAAAAMFLLVGALLAPPSGERHAVLVLSALAIPVAVAAALIEGTLRGLGSQIASMLPNRLLRPASFVAGMLLLSPLPLGAGAGLALNVACGLLAVLASAAAMRRWLPRTHEPVPPGPNGSWLSTAGGLAANAMVLSLLGQIDILVLGMFHDTAVLGSYGAVMRVATIVTFATTVVVTVLQPSMAAAWGRSDWPSLARVATDGGRTALLLSLGFAIVVVPLAPRLLAIFGPDFVSAAPALRILTLAFLFSSPFSMANAVLAMIGRQNLATGVMLAASALALLLNLALAPRFGSTGAAVATAVTWVTFNVALFVLSRRVLGLPGSPMQALAWPSGAAR
jgi:O-antigen/teichoic acid export membrane protein